MRGKRRKTGILEDSTILIIPTSDKPVKIAYENSPITSEEDYLKAIENLFNNIGHLNGTIPKDQFWLSSKGWIKKANCTKCKNAYIEDIWYEWMCKKAGRIPLDEEGFPVDCEFECMFFEEE